MAAQRDLGSREQKEPLPPQGRSLQLRLVWVLTLAVAAVLVWSAIHPKDRATWLLEVLPVLIAWPLLAFTYGRLRFTSLTYTFIALHMIVLMVGGHYTYAEVPLFDWLRDTFHMARNNYDRLGHFMQGFVPALVAREVLLRASPLKRGKWLFALVICVCMTVSALYELLEWGTAVVAGSAADSFLGTQGDPWDTQWDMAMALTGSLLAQVCLAPWQDRQMRRQEEECRM